MTSDPPPPPDPAATGAAQTATNVDTAIANARLSHTNQVDANGNSLTYNQSGTAQMVDQQGKSYDLPTYTAVQKYSDANQKISDTTQQTKQGLANIGLQQTGKIGELLGTNADLSATNLDKYSNTHWMGGFNDQWDKAQASNEQHLADQGITPGSEAYNNANQQFSLNKQNAMNSYLGSQYGNAQNSILQARNQPINEISALQSGSQIANPSMVNTPSTTLPTVDTAGLINQGYQQQMQNYNAEQSQNQALMSGLFGLGSTVAGGWMRSDRRLKTDISRIGSYASGLAKYAFRFWNEPDTHIGAMADEVIGLMPDAVRVGDDGYFQVDYSRIV